VCCLNLQIRKSDLVKIAKTETVINPYSYQILPYQTATQMSLNFTASLVLLFYLNAAIAATAYNIRDTTSAKRSLRLLKFTGRAHSAGYFYYGGKLAERNPSFDITMNLETATVGYTFLKAVDLADIHSSFNFALAGIHKHIAIGKKLKITPQFVVLIEQPTKIVDEGSDVGATFTLTYKPSRSITIEETLILFNLVFETTHLDCINRGRVTWSQKHLDVMLTGWHNNSFLDREAHATSTLSIAYNRIKFGERITVGTAVMGSSTFFSTDSNKVPERHAIVFSLTVSII
jgi:hypothetical protein